ncbi:MAG: hypothetical protein GY810_30060 [Aureispira sp.]|nr:hypothetical protein [Aureispira sp.]
MVNLYAQPLAELDLNNENVKITYHFDSYYWIVKLHNIRDSLWDSKLEFSKGKHTPQIQETLDDGYLILGSSRSPGEYLHFDGRMRDHWIVKLAPNPTDLCSENLYQELNFKIYPIPSTTYIYLKTDLSLHGEKCIIYDDLGKPLSTQTITSTNTFITLEGLRFGSYTLFIKDQSASFCIPNSEELFGL